MRKSILLMCLLAWTGMMSIQQAVAKDDSVYRVINVAPGEGLPVYQEPDTTSKVLVKIPHNASWIVLRRDYAAGWQKISWNDQTGWIQEGRLEFDRAATDVVQERNDCLTDPTVSNKMCCGFPPGAQSEVFKSVEVYSVIGIPKGQSLALKAEPGSASKTIVLMPYNATWIVKNNKTQSVGADIWEKVSWSGNVGWVKSDYINFNSELTKIGDLKRQQCSIPAGCAPDFSGAEDKSKT